MNAVRIPFMSLVPGEDAAAVRAAIEPRHGPAAGAPQHELLTQQVDGEDAAFGKILRARDDLPLVAHASRDSAEPDANMPRVHETQG